VLNRLSGDRLRQKADEIAGMPGVERHADLTLSFEAADPGAMTGAGIDHDEWSLVLINLDIGWWDDPHQHVIHRVRKLTPVHAQLAVKLQHVGRFFRYVLFICFGTLPHNVEKQYSALNGIESVRPSFTREVNRPRRRGYRRPDIHLFTHEPFS
jgi:hypothetical protein